MNDYLKNVRHKAFIEELEKIAQKDKKKKDNNIAPYLLAQAGGYAGSRSSESYAKDWAKKHIKNKKLRPLISVGAGALGLSAGLFGGYYAGKKINN
jgi:fatty acid-binding protein DegV